MWASLGPLLHCRQRALEACASSPSVSSLLISSVEASSARNTCLSPLSNEHMHHDKGLRFQGHKMVLILNLPLLGVWSCKVVWLTWSSIYSSIKWVWWWQGCNSANLDSRQSCIPSLPCHDVGASGPGPGKLCVLLPGHTPPSKISALSPNPHNNCISQLSLNNKSPQTQWPKYVPRPTRIRGVRSSSPAANGQVGKNHVHFCNLPQLCRASIEERSATGLPADCIQV